MALTVNSKLCLRRMEMQQKYGYTRSTISESKQKATTSADVHLELVGNLLSPKLLEADLIRR